MSRTRRYALSRGAVTFSPAERESFFDSIARHQRAAIRVALVADACAFALAFVVAVLMSPLLYAALGLLLDLINLLVPTPDLIGIVGNAAVTLADDFSAMSTWRWLYVAVIAWSLVCLLGPVWSFHLAASGDSPCAAAPNSLSCMPRRR